jgi:hypothetical protein
MIASSALRPPSWLTPHGENRVRDGVEVGPHLFQHIGLTVNDRLDQADEDMGTGVMGG